MVKKERPRIVNKTVLTKMLPQSYQTCFQNQLKATQYVTLQILVGLLQFYKQVSIELLATLMPEPILFESRRRSLQRFLVVPQLNIKSLWFPVVKHFLRSHFKKTCPLTLAIDRTQWRNRNLFVVSLIWDKRAIPIYWLILSKQGASNLREQQTLLKPVFQLMFKDCKTGGYNLEGSHASEERLINLVLLIAIAYICALVQGKEIKQKKVQKYVGRVKEYRRRYRRHSTFWVGLYGELWLSSLELCPDLVAQLMRLKPNKRTHFQRKSNAFSCATAHSPSIPPNFSSNACNVSICCCNC